MLQDIYLRLLIQDLIKLVMGLSQINGVKNIPIILKTAQSQLLNWFPPFLCKNVLYKCVSWHLVPRILDYAPRKEPPVPFNDYKMLGKWMFLTHMEVNFIKKNTF